MVYGYWALDVGFPFIWNSHQRWSTKYTWHTKWHLLEVSGEVLVNSWLPMGGDVATQVEFSSLECLELQMFQILGFGMAAYTYISCVCICLQVYMGVSTYVHMRVEARGWHCVSLSALSLKTGLSLNLDLINWARLAGQWVPGPVFLIPQCWRHTTASGFWHGYQESTLRFSCLPHEHFSTRAISSTPSHEDKTQVWTQNWFVYVCMCVDTHLHPHTHIYMQKIILYTLKYSVHETKFAYHRWQSPGGPLFIWGHQISCVPCSWHLWPLVGGQECRSTLVLSWTHSESFRPSNIFGYLAGRHSAFVSF